MDRIPFLSILFILSKNVVFAFRREFNYNPLEGGDAQCPT